MEGNDEDCGDAGAEALRRASVLRPLVQAYLNGTELGKRYVMQSGAWRQQDHSLALDPTACSRGWPDKRCSRSRKRGRRNGSVMVPGDVEGIIEEHLTDTTFGENAPAWRELCQKSAAPAVSGGFSR